MIITWWSFCVQLKCGECGQRRRRLRVYVGNGNTVVFEQTARLLWIFDGQFDGRHCCAQCTQWTKFFRLLRQQHTKYQFVVAVIFRWRKILPILNRHCELCRSRRAHIHIGCHNFGANGPHREPCTDQHCRHCEERLTIHCLRSLLCSSRAVTSPPSSVSYCVRGCSVIHNLLIYTIIFGVSFTTVLFYDSKKYYSFHSAFIPISLSFGQKSESEINDRQSVHAVRTIFQYVFR